MFEKTFKKFGELSECIKDEAQAAVKEAQKAELIHRREFLEFVDTVKQRFKTLKKF